MATLKPPQIKFIKSAVLPADYPPAVLPEVAIAGRSNAGKSSFINGLLISTKIAKVSSTPGKTRLLNFFEVNSKYTLVDMPGYGFAARAGDEMENWQKMIEGYLVSRSTLKGLLLVMDIRRDWSEDEEALRLFLEPRGIPMALILTKSDKLNRSELAKATEKIKNESHLSHIFLTSALEKQGQLEVEDFVFRNWVKS